MSDTWWLQATDLDSDQTRVLKLRPDASFLVSGPPGSGKTNLLALRAKYLQRLGVENFVVLAFQQPLIRFLKLSHAVDDDKLHTAMGWLKRVNFELGLPDVEAPDFKSARLQLCSAIYAELKRRNLAGLVRTILVDEAQDYTTDEIRLFVRYAENVFLVGDSRQQIYSSGGGLSDIAREFPQIEQVELKVHYRVGKEICALADRLAGPEKNYKPILPTCKYDEESNPSKVVVEKGTLDHQLATIIDHCRNQVVTFPGEFIGVLCPTNSVLTSVEATLRRAFGSVVQVQQSSNYSDMSASSPIFVATIHGAKGLEFRCVHIPELEKLRKIPCPRELAYTAVTRAKTTLCLYYDKPPLAFLADAIRLSTPNPFGGIDDLF